MKLVMDKNKNRDDQVVRTIIFLNASGYDYLYQIFN